MHVLTTRLLSRRCQSEWQHRVCDDRSNNHQCWVFNIHTTMPTIRCWTDDSGASIRAAAVEGSETTRIVEHYFLLTSISKSSLFSQLLLLSSSSYLAFFGSTPIWTMVVVGVPNSKSTTSGGVGGGFWCTRLAAFSEPTATPFSGWMLVLVG